MQQFQLGGGGSGGYNPHHPQHHPPPGNGEPPPWAQGYNNSAQQQQQQQMYSQEGFPHQMGGPPQMEMGQQPWWPGPHQGMVRAPSPSEMSPGFRMPGGNSPQVPGPWALRGTRPRMDRRGPMRPRMSSRGPDEQSPPSMGPSMSPPPISQAGGVGGSQPPPFPFGGSEMINDLIPSQSSGIGRGVKRGPGRPRGALIPPGVPTSALMDSSITSPPGPGSAVSAGITNSSMSPVMESTDSLIGPGPLPTTPSGKTKGVNNNKKRYVCEICQKRFSTAWYVRVHRRSHNGERPYLCRNCGKGFMLPNVLQVHLRKCEKNNAPVDGLSPEVERQHQSPPLSSPNGPPGMPGGPMSNYPNHPHMSMGVPMGPGEGAGPPPGMNHMPHSFGPGPPMGPGGGNNDLGGFNNQRFMSSYNMGGEPGSGHPGYNNAIPPQGGPPMQHHGGYDMPSPGPPPHSMGPGGSPSPHPFPQQIPPPAMYSPGGGGGGGGGNGPNNPPPGGLPGGHPGSGGGHIPGGGPPPPTNEHDPSSVHFLANDRPLEKGGGDGPVADKDLYCAMCEIQFTEKSQLEDHLKSHRPYSCDVCEKRFSQKCNLITHLRLHTGEKPYPCTFCDKRFTQKGNLDAHHKTHTKEKPYPCNQCGRKFAFKSSMLSHVRQAHGGLIGELDDLDDISSIKQQLKYNSSQDPGSPNNFSSGIPTPQSSLDSIPSSQGIGNHPGSYHATYQSHPGGMIHHGYPGSMTPSTDSSETSSNAASDISKTLASQESTLAMS